MKWSTNCMYCTIAMNTNLLYLSRLEVIDHRVFTNHLKWGETMNFMIPGKSGKTLSFFLKHILVLSPYHQFDVTLYLRTLEVSGLHDLLHVISCLLDCLLTAASSRSTNTFCSVVYLLVLNPHTHTDCLCTAKTLIRHVLRIYIHIQ